MSENRGIFSLDEFYDLQISGETSKILDVFRYVNSVVGTANPYGYARNGSYSGIDRIDFNNDTATASAKGSMATGETKNESGFGNLNYGYITGGKGSGPGAYPSNWATTSISRIDYANDASTASPKGPYSAPVYNHAGVGNMDYGYSIAGQDFGYPGPNIRYSTIVRMDYSNDTVSPPAKSNYPFEGSGNFGMSGTGNMDYGWIANGIYDNSIVHRIDYSSDTTAPTSRTYLDRYGTQGRKCTGNASYGYWQGGYTQTKFSRVDFSNDTATGVTKGSSHRGYENGSVTSKDYAYLYGQYYPYSSIVERMDYSNDDIAAAPKGPLSVTNGGGQSVAGVSAQQFGLPTAPVPATRTETHIGPVGSDFGYFSGGQNSTIDRLDYSNDSAATSPKGKNTTSKKEQAAFSSLTHGYWAGGRPAPLISTVDRLDFSNDTANASPKGPLSSPAGAMGGAGTVNYGYVFGTYDSPPTSTIQRVDFSNDTATAPALNTLSTAFGGKQSAGNQNYAWNAGGYAGSPLGNRTDVERLDYGSDTSSLSPKGNLSNPQFFGTQVSSGSYGYVCAGPNGNSRVDRIDYSNDTATASPKGPLSVNDPNGGGTSNTSYGYIALGGPRSTIDRIDFSNDTPTSSNRSTLTNSLTQINECHTSSRENNAPTTGPEPATVDKGAEGYLNTTTTLGPAYGYWSGGIGPSNLSSVDRIDYASDATNMVTKGPLTEVGYYFVGISSPAYGYTCGNLYPGYKSYVQRADYANDTATAVLKGPLTRSDGSGAGLNSRSYGYVAGGQNPGNNSYVDRIDFSNDSATASPKGNLDTGRGKCAGTSNQNYGWATGGIEPGTTKVSRIDFSNDTATSSPKGDMVTARMGHSGSGNADYGYLAAGNNNYKSSVDRIDYSNDTATAVEKGPLSIGRRYVDGVSSPSYGWHAGGETPTKISTCDRIDYSNDTATAAVKGPLTTTRAWFMGNHSSQSNDGGTSTSSFIPRIRWVDSASQAAASVAGPAFAYIAGGKNPSSSHLSLIDRIEFANDTPTASPKGNLNTSRSSTGGTGNKSYGYFAGGSNVPTSTTLTIVDRIDYSSDTSTAAPKGPLTTATTYGVATGNLNFGYVHVGNGPAITKIERIDYSNDTANALRKGEIGYTAYAGSATGNPDFGYFSGGYPSNTYIHRVDYTNDTATTSPKGNLTFGRYGHAGSSNLNFGYFSGGSPGPTSKVDRIDYSNDTATASLKGPLSSSTNRTGLGGVGNAESGYVTGGNTLTIVDRIDYSNDTATASVKGSLSSARRYNAGTSALMLGFPQTTTAAIAAPVQPPFPFPVQLPDPRGPAYGYFSGGFNPSNSPAHPSAVYYSNVDRVDFASDTSTASPKGKLDQARANAGAAGSPSYGYIGASDLTSGYSSIVARVDYANDSATAVVKGSMAPGTDRYQAATSNTSYGWFSGGAPSGTNSKVQRIDFSNDDTTASPRGNLTLARQAFAGAGNADYGWHAGGYGWPAPDYIRSVVDRIDYSNDSVTATPKGYLSVKRRGLSGTGNASYGYYSGGYNVVPGGNNWVSSIDRIDYSNDSPTATPKGNLSQPRSRGSATGNQSYGYAVGGEGSNNDGLSTVDRIDFANDTATAATKGPLTYTARGYSGFSARANALPQ